MKIVIDMPEKRYKDIQRIAEVQLKKRTDTLEQIVANGTPLPKGHGDLIILSNDELKENLMDLSFSCQKWISEVGLSFATVAIIEAESEEEE